MPNLRVITPTCNHCGKRGALEVDSIAYNAWKEGALIQEVLPDMDKADREQLMTGIHPACWIEIFAEEE
jgi:hypothetical protein